MRHSPKQARQRAPKGPSQRQLRAGELIRHTLVDILAREDLREPALQGFSVTISEVRPSPDMRHADVFCSVLGARSQGVDEAAIVDALNKVAPHLRGLLGRQMTMKYTPALKFRRDPSFDEASRIDALLSKPEVARDLDHDDGLVERDDQPLHD
ncbi:MAG: 30S ribosome-binding factor RbfA [Pseudomonadota bacterium]